MDLANSSAILRPYSIEDVTIICNGLLFWSTEFNFLPMHYFFHVCYQLLKNSLTIDEKSTKENPNGVVSLYVIKIRLLFSSKFFC